MSDAIERSGIYGANDIGWPDRLWNLVELGTFRWMVVRADSGPSIAARARAMELKVIVQMPDHFNRGSWDAPGDHAQKCHLALKPFEPFSGLAVLDNEPNLVARKGSRWYAEEFCRWYRAVVAEFRYQDSASPWELIFPGMAMTPLLDIDYWMEVNRENIQESRGIGVHCYWYNRSQLDEPYWGGSWRQVASMYPDRELYILEYGELPPGSLGSGMAQNQADFVADLTDPVVCACKFILGGTKEWQHFFLDEAQAKALAAI
ncbi:MAG: hypothetical protein M1531_09105 [Chloroflexi bacterium]|nr:hypothetical protein [Chloroflexota bacterium]